MQQLHLLSEMMSQQLQFLLTSFIEYMLKGDDIMGRALGEFIIVSAAKKKCHFLLLEKGHDLHASIVLTPFM